MATSMQKSVMRQLKALADAPIEGACAAPCDGDLNEIHCTVVGPEGTSYAGVPIHFVLELGAEYPMKAPNAFFVTDISYQNGATNRDAKGRTAVCLNLFGNFANYHREWGTEAEGWSPAYTLETVLVQMQGVLHENYLSSDPRSVEQTRKSACQLKCGCGHTNDAPHPPIPTAEDVKAALEKRGKGKAGEPPRCYATGAVLGEEGVVLGIGLSVEPNGQLKTPAEYLSAEAFEEREVRRSSDNTKTFDLFLPLGMSSAHFSRAEARLKRSLAAICSALGDKAKEYKEKGMAPTLAWICGQLMTSLVVEVNQAGDVPASDRFIELYFQLLLLLRLADVVSKGRVAAFARNGVVGPFLESRRARQKDRTPNLGVVTALLPLSGFAWEEVRGPICEESETRNVFWAVQGTRSSPAPHTELADPANQDPERDSKMFAATAVSRKLMCFQRRFLGVAASVSTEDLEQGCGTVGKNVLSSIKSTHSAVQAMKGWAEHREFLGLPEQSREKRRAELAKAVVRSKEVGYHGCSFQGKGGKGKGGKGKGGKGSVGKGYKGRDGS